MSEFPSHWTNCLLGERIRFEYGKSPNEVRSSDGKYPMYGSSGKSALANNYTTESPAIIVGRKGTIDKPIFLQERCWAIDTTFFIDNFPSDEPRYLYYLLDSINLKSLNESTGVPSLSRDALHSIPVSLPPLPEQKKIAEILSGIDRCICEQQNKIDIVAAILENVSSQILDNISGDPATHHKRIDEVSILKGGNGFPIEHQGVTHGGTPFIKVSDFNNPGNENEIKTANNYLSEESMSSLRPHVFPVNTIVFAKVGAALTSNRRRLLSTPTCIDNNLMGAIPKGVEPLYLKLLLEKIDFNEFCQDGAVPSVNQSQIGCIKVPIPSTEKQIKAVLAVESFRATRKTLEAKRDKFLTLKNALASDLLSGRKRVSI